MTAKPMSRNPRAVTRALRCITVAMLGAVTSAGSVRAQAVAGVPQVLNATALDDELELNGLMDEPVWALADSIAALTQTEPVQGAAPTGQTAVKVLVTGDALVIGIRADDPDPARIVSYARSRDAGLENEDHVKLVLDTFGDGRSGYIFAVNPGGARYDALVANRGEGENSDWDGIWEAATARTPQGWSAEIRIPIRSLMFKEGLDTWGFNIERRIERLQDRKSVV